PVRTGSGSLPVARGPPDRLVRDPQLLLPESLQAVPKLFHPQTDSRLDRSQGHMHTFGDLRVRQSLIEGELDRLLLHRRQGLERSPARAWRSLAARMSRASAFWAMRSEAGVSSREAVTSLPRAASARTQSMARLLASVTSQAIGAPRAVS